MVKQKLGFWERLASQFFRCFQDRNADWMAVTFRDDPTDLPERRARFIEEALELDQSLGGSREEAHALVEYVYGRAVGVPHQELGGTMVCLAGLAEFASLDMDRAGEDELRRVSTPEMIDKIRRKRASRHGRGPLPGFSFPDAPRVPAHLRGAPCLCGAAEGELCRNDSQQCSHPDRVVPQYTEAPEAKAKRDAEHDRATAAAYYYGSDKWPWLGADASSGRSSPG